MTIPELIALARKATPGPWIVEGNTLYIRHDKPPFRESVDWFAFPGNAGTAAYFAALSPEFVIALAEVAEAAKEMKETIAANRLMLGHHMGVEWLYREEKSWDSALSRLTALQHETGDEK